MQSEVTQHINGYRRNCHHIDACFPRDGFRSSRTNKILKSGYLKNTSVENMPLFNGPNSSDIYVKYVFYITDTIRKKSAERKLREM